MKVTIYLSTTTMDWLTLSGVGEIVEARYSDSVTILLGARTTVDPKG
jgi:hypothetical protein